MTDETTSPEGQIVAQGGSSPPAAGGNAGTFVRDWVLFALVGLMLYGGLYAASEQLVYRYGRRNRFHMVSTAPYSRYDHVILGASHAAVFDFEDMNDRLEQMTGSTILNLSVVGAGVTVNRLLLEYFLARHQTSTVIYVADSFAFYSPQWNEDRLGDARLLLRAPVDPALARLLLQNASTRSAAFSYLFGFAKVNNPDRFKPDVSEDEATRFSRTYRPVRQIDRERLAYLYPSSVDERHRQRYFAQLEDLIEYARAHGLRFVVIRPPLPERIYRMIPNEVEFGQALKALADRHGVQLYDFSLMCNDEKFFFDSDHLNRSGVVNFFENCLKDTLGR
jgi:hypothetical protein